jgi:hypothetical protein
LIEADVDERLFFLREKWSSWEVGNGMGIGEPISCPSQKFVA